MTTKWRGTAEFRAELHAMTPRMERELQALAFFTAKQMVQDGNQNMGDMGIRIRTGRSRALFAAALEGKLGAVAGYTKWPERVVFYPEFLNNGTRRMAARPYFDLAFEQQEPGWNAGLDRILSGAVA